MKNLTALHIIFLFLASNVFAQVRDSVRVNEPIPDSLDISPADTTNIIEAEPEPEEEPEIVIPWKEQTPIATSIITTDSLLRWQIWPNFGDFYAYRRDVISFRQGTAGRLDAFHIDGYLPYEQKLRMEGISLNNPITGLINYNLVPHRKIAKATEELRGYYQTEINLTDYYIIQPISYLNYDESGHEYRNLEFMVSQNFTESTNLELSYWDRRGGGFYPNNGIEGSQVVAKAYHHLNQKYMAKAFYLRNNFNSEEPFGYAVTDPLAFSFNEFTSPPISSNGNSDFARWDLVTGIYHRKDSSAAEDAGFEARISKNKKELRFSGDTLGWNVRTIGTRMYKNLMLGNFEAKAEVDWQSHKAADFSAITKKNWNILNAGLDVGFQLGNAFLLFGKAKINGRSDNEKGYDVGGGIKTDIKNRLQFTLGAFSFSRSPHMQAKYWQSKNYRGNPDLINETGLSLNGQLDFWLGDRLKFGASARYKSAENAVFLSADSSFINSGSFQQIAGTVFGRFEGSLLELESSATTQLFDYANTSTPLAAVNHLDQIIWLRNSAFLKGYVFDRAAYLKIGLKTLFSPAFYSSRTFNAELGYWQGNSSYQELPAFFRLDAELSARVRAIMVVIRWENALDGLGQAGYFEAAGYPMPPRRLIVGIRAQFRN